MSNLLKLLCCLLPHFVFAQVVDFENLPHLAPGDPVGVITLEEEDYEIQFYIGHDIQDTVPLRIQKVGFHSYAGGFYGPESDVDCEGNKVAPERINQINAKKFTLNPSLSNKERVGCHFVSGVLLGEVLPSIFIFYNKPVTGCSADLLDVDGHENTIEAYDIYCYATPADYPLNPVSIKPIEIRALGKTYGHGILGDNGGVMPFNIDLDSAFSLIEIRPIQQVTGRNTIRNEFGFALDNYSPKSIEQAPYIPPYMSGDDNHVTVSRIEDKKFIVDTSPNLANTNNMAENNQDSQYSSIYFDFDEASISTAAIVILDDLVKQVSALFTEGKTVSINLSGFTDPKGNDAYNINLSKNRVNAAAAYLIQQGIKESTIKKSHYGEAYQGSANDSDAKKRTVKIEINY